MDAAPFQESGLIRSSILARSTFRSRLPALPPRILTAMFEVLRATAILGLLAAGIPSLLSAQTAVSAALPPGQQTGKTAAAKPITASGFVASGPIVFEDISEKAGLTKWTHTMGTPA